MINYIYLSTSYISQLAQTQKVAYFGSNYVGDSWSSTKFTHNAAKLPDQFIAIVTIQQKKNI